MPTALYGSEPYGGLTPPSSEGLLTYTTKTIVQNFMGVAIASALDTHIEFLSLSVEDIRDRYTSNGIVAKRRRIGATHPILPFLTRINKCQTEKSISPMVGALFCFMPSTDTLHICAIHYIPEHRRVNQQGRWVLKKREKCESLASLLVRLI